MLTGETCHRRRRGRSAGGAAVLRRRPRAGMERAGRVGKCLPGAARASDAPIASRPLLAHSSGLPAILEVWRLAGSAEERFAAVVAEPLVGAPGTVVKYSDPGFMILGRIV